MFVYVLGLLYMLTLGNLEETYVGVSYYEAHMRKFCPWQATVTLDHEL